jgi:hypothetical protein
VDDIDSQFYHVAFDKDMLDVMMRALLQIRNKCPEEEIGAIVKTVRVFNATCPEVGAKYLCDQFVKTIVDH